jgi:mitogen-activated protein kinase 15
MYLQALSGHENIIRLQHVIKAENDRDIYLTFDHMETGAYAFLRPSPRLLLCGQYLEVEVSTCSSPSLLTNPFPAPSSRTTDLHAVIRAGILADIHKKYIIWQLLKALKYLHSADLLHRDIKPSNLLLNSDCHIKVCDFGLCRSVAESAGPAPVLTDYVATRWYRAPEILLGSTRYTRGVDMWAVGCILGEMILGKPLFPGNSTMNQLERVLEWVQERVLERPSYDEEPLQVIDWLGQRELERLLERVLIGDLEQAAQEPVPTSLLPLQLKEELCLSHQEWALG